MNIKKFVAPTSREALAKARMAFGDGTLILSNRPTAGGVEVVATAEDALASSLDAGVPTDPAPLQAAPRRAAPLSSRIDDESRRSLPAAAPARSASARSTVDADTEQLAMSTLSFQDYVRERMLRRRHEALQGSAPASSAPAAFSDRAALQQPLASPAPVARHNPLRNIAVELPPEPPRKPRASAQAAPAAPSLNQRELMSELHAMRDLIEDRFNTLAWMGQARQNPIHSSLMLKMIRAGYSPALARAVLERMPEDLPAAESVRWLMDVLERNLKTDAGQQPLYQEGGIYALVGATGVGKTTTTAKLAALCARIHGPGSVGLITLDTYRIGAHEQLRSYGRMLGVVAHLAHDRAALQDLLGLLAGKKMVLIDTTGVAPRDPRKRDMLGVLDLPGVNRLMVLNAGSHGDTLDEVLNAFKSRDTHQAILSKIDEAVKLGPSIDALIRHQMVLRGVTNGQRVPEDWEGADAQKLIAASMRSPAKSAFDPKSADLDFFFSHSSDTLQGSAEYADA